MLNSHPLFVHYPLALWAVPVIFMVGWLLFRRPALDHAAAGALALGTAAGLLAAATGLLAGATVPHPEEAHELMETHEAFALTSLGLAVVLSGWRLWLWPRWPRLRSAFPVALIALALLVTYTGHLGGQMVYRYGVGTTAVRFAAEETEHHHHH